MIKMSIRTDDTFASTDANLVTNNKSVKMENKKKPAMMIGFPHTLAIFVVKEVSATKKLMVIRVGSQYAYRLHC